MNAFVISFRRRVIGVLSLTVALTYCPRALAHCDTLDGPVVQAARRALEERNVKLVLIWVQKSDEAEIGRVFQHALAVRALGHEARDLADRFFFETLVRVHRAGEGAAFTGLKPAGTDFGLAVRSADKAIESGDLQLLLRVLSFELNRGLGEQFNAVMSRRKFPPNDVAAGRDYVRAYVGFMHYVEAVQAAVNHAPLDHAAAKVEHH
jgi:hypothetical protein